LSMSNSRSFFCSVICSNQWLGSKKRDKNHPNWINGRSVYKNLLKRTDVAVVCKLCGEKDIRVLAVHHIDKNRENNTLANLAWLCLNCHFLVHHHTRESGKLTDVLKR
jgi:hypothetical protein